MFSVNALWFHLLYFTGSFVSVGNWRYFIVGISAALESEERRLEGNSWSCPLATAARRTALEIQGHCKKRHRVDSKVEAKRRNMNFSQHQLPAKLLMALTLEAYFPQQDSLVGGGMRCHADDSKISRACMEGENRPKLSFTQHFEMHITPSQTYTYMHMHMRAQTHISNGKRSKAHFFLLI